MILNWKQTKNSHPHPVGSIWMINYQGGWTDLDADTGAARYWFDEIIQILKLHGPKV